MLSSEIAKQGQLFLEAVLLGACFWFVYDVLRIFRRVFRQKTALVAVEDILFWFICALGLFGFMYRKNDGTVRGFLVLGAALGMLLYGVSFSRYVVRAGTVCLGGAVNLLKKLFRAVSRPLRKLGSRVQRSARFFRREVIPFFRTEHSPRTKE